MKIILYLSILIFFSGSVTNIEVEATNNKNCKGLLPLPCTCSEQVIDCSNALINTTDIFLNIPIHWPKLVTLNMAGNKLEYLEMDLFNLKSGLEWSNLEQLDLSRCQIQGIHARTFEGLPKLEELILSNNALSFRGVSSNDQTPVGRRIWPTENFLEPISKSIKILDLSDAFDRRERRDAPETFVTNLTKFFNETEFPLLQYLNLSSNHLTSLPSNIFCRCPYLEFLYLTSNRLYAFTTSDDQCLRSLVELQLQSNFIRRIDETFMNFIDTRQALKSIYLYDNPFTCDCETQKFIRWSRQSTKLSDKTRLICTRAKPRDYVDQSLIGIPEEKLRCASDASEYLHGVYILCGVAFVGLIALLACIVYTNRSILCKQSARNWMPLGGYQSLGREPEVKAEMV